MMVGMQEGRQREGFSCTENAILYNFVQMLFCPGNERSLRAPSNLIQLSSDNPPFSDEICWKQWSNDFLVPCNTPQGLW